MQVLKTLLSKCAILHMVRKGQYWQTCSHKCTEAKGLWGKVYAGKEIHPFRHWDGHSTRTRSGVSVWTCSHTARDEAVSWSFLLPGNLLLASSHGYRWRKEDRFLPALQHCTRKQKVKQSFVRNVTFYFLTLLWSTNPLVLKLILRVLNSNKSLNKGVSFLGVKQLSISQLLSCEQYQRVCKTS